MIRVFIADDHAIVRHGLREVLAQVPDMQVVGEAVDGRATLNAVEALEFDVLLLDLSLPRVSGMEVLRRVRASHPTIAIVVLSMYPTEQYARWALRQGAAAYLSKEWQTGEIVAAIRDAVTVGHYVSPSMKQELGGNEELPHDHLTAREYQVFTLLYQGKTVSDIAAELNIGANTVSTYVAAIRSKLGVKSVGEIIRYAMRAGLVEEVPLPPQ